jgi:hypothetical protein
MRKILISLLLCCSFGSVYALDNSVDVTNLSDQQKATVIKAVADLKAEKSTVVANAVSTPEKVGEWVKIGSQVAELIPVFAEKTGIAADKVLNSTAGQILLAIVLVQYFWAKIMGVLFFSIGTYVWWRMYRSSVRVASVEKVEHPNSFLNWIGLRRSNFTYYSASQSAEILTNGGWLWFVALAVILIAGLVGITH